MMKNIRRFFRKDFVIVTLIIINTFLYFVLSNIPEGFARVDFYFFEMGSFGFPDISHLVHYLKMKILIIGFALIWYFTCSHWWKSAILVIIAIELSKIITSLNSTNFAIDEIDYIVSLPITIPIILALLFISKKLNNYNLSIELRTKIGDEINNTFFELNEKNEKDLILLEQEFDLAKKFKSTLNTFEYVKKLITIRDKFYKV